MITEDRQTGMWVWHFRKPQAEDAKMLRNIMKMCGTRNERDRWMKSEFYHDYILALAQRVAGGARMNENIERGIHG